MQIKEGDLVILIRGGKIDWEACEWTAEAGLRINSIYEVEKVASNGHDIKIKNHKYYHHPDHFRKITYQNIPEDTREKMEDLIVKEFFKDKINA